MDVISNGPVMGFKATDSNGVCKPSLFARQEYRVGETYSLPGGCAPRMCEKGFHFCDQLYEVFTYYPVSVYTRVFVVEALGIVLKQRRELANNWSSKCVTDKIRIVRELSRREILDRLEHESVNKRYTERKRRRAAAILDELKFANTLIETTKRRQDE